MAQQIDLRNGIEIVKYPTFTYRLNRDNDRILFFVDELEAIRQMVYKVLSTERNDYVIYKNNYGFEIKDLFGKSSSYVKIVLKRRITESILIDDRVTSVEDFRFPKPQDNTKGTVCVEFTVVSIFGKVDIIKEVDL